MVKAFFILFFCAQYTFLFADTVFLKNGRKLEGLIKSEDSQFVELEVCAGSVRLKPGEIARIERSGPNEAQLLREQWDRQKIETQQKIISQQEQEALKPRKVEFTQEGYNIVVNAKLNGKVDARLVLDTGASIIMLRKNIAEQLGMKLDTVASDMQVELADGRKVKAKHIFLDSVMVENAEARNVEASILLEDVGAFGDGLLGMSFLKQFNFKVDQRNKRLILERL